MLVELAIGDAYGAGFEYGDRSMLETQNDLSRYVQHPRHRGTRPGMYTDDTQMSLAIAEVIADGSPWTPTVLADAFVRAFKRDPREGYAGGFHAFLCNVRDGKQFLAEIRGDSDKSGAAMRAGPIGIFPTPMEVIERTTIQARLTHNTPDGIGAACAAALLAHFCLYQLGDRRDAGRFICSHVPGEWDQPWSGKVGSKGWMSVRAAITAVARNDCMSDLLRDCIAFAGDVDTVATIALAAASCSDQITQDLPQALYNTLENGKFGHDYIASFDTRLMALARPAIKGGQP